MNCCRPLCLREESAFATTGRYFPARTENVPKTLPKSSMMFLTRRIAANAAVSALKLAGIVLLASCGDQKPPPSTPKVENSVVSKGSQAVELPSVVGKLGRYQLVDYGKKPDREGFFAYRDVFMRSAAAASDFDKSKFAEMAFVEVGSETDAFKREDKAKALQAKLDDLVKSPVKFLRLTNSTSERNIMARVSAYDMASESYTVRFLIDSLTYGYGYEESPRHYGYDYGVQTPSIRRVETCFQCSKDFEVLVKVPKDRAREIEAKLAPLRPSAIDTAGLSTDFYVSVDKIASSGWEKAEVRVNIDAVALRLPGQIEGEPLMFIDGPQFKRK